MFPKATNYIFIAIVVVLVIGAIVLLVMSSQTEQEPVNNLKSTATSTGTSTIKEIYFKKELPKPPLAKAEKERYAKLETALEKRWQREIKLIASSSKEVGLTDEQIKRIQEFFEERNKEYLDISSRTPASNKEYEKALSRLNKRFREACIKYLDRQLFQKLADKAPVIFKTEKPPSKPHQDR